MEGGAVTNKTLLTEGVINWRFCLLISFSRYKSLSFMVPKIESFQFSGVSGFEGADHMLLCTLVTVRYVSSAGGNLGSRKQGWPCLQTEEFKSANAVCWLVVEMLILEGVPCTK